MASSASKAVEAATAFMNGEAEEQASKRPRVFPPGPSVAAGSQDVLLTQPSPFPLGSDQCSLA